ncbi:hypothetical protein EXIGLDRAFT_782079 [Exidia glandulosa HHB12029]|uniref:Uncharacterized protein n=1 Tax=Exidia glandulosa HHB12029 TaxID=1314781 RepID=A0A165B0J8_EXIGL|nr:hypothetical protein EXIGLDRAFT_782079 [Exidia glandulosa HHB12029]
MDAQAFIKDPGETGDRLEWLYRVKWMDYEFDSALYPHDCFSPDSLTKFWDHVDATTVRPDGLYTHQWRIAAGQSYIDKCILDALACKKSEVPDDEVFDLQGELDTLKRRHDFALVGRSINTACALARENQESIYRRIRAPYLTGPAPIPPRHRRTSKNDLCLVLDEIFELEDKQPEVQVDRVQVQQNGWEAPQLIDIVIDNNDDVEDEGDDENVVDAMNHDGGVTIEYADFDYEQVADDGFPARLERIPFHKYRTPQKALFQALGVTAMRLGTKRWRSMQNRVCGVGDGRSLANIATECGHFFIKSNLQTAFETLGPQCPMCRHQLRFCPFPAHFFERPTLQPPVKQTFDERPTPVIAAPAGQPRLADVQAPDGDEILQLAETQEERVARQKAKKNKRRGGKKKQEKMERKAKREAREAAGKPKNRRGKKRKGEWAAGQHSEPSGSGNAV